MFDFNLAVLQIVPRQRLLIIDPWTHLIPFSVQISTFLSLFQSHNWQIQLRFGRVPGGAGGGALAVIETQLFSGGEGI